MRLLALLILAAACTGSASAETTLRSLRPGHTFTVYPRVLAGLGYSIAFQDGGLVSNLWQAWDYRSPICAIMNGTVAATPSLGSDPLEFTLANISGVYAQGISIGERPPYFQTEIYLRSSAGMVQITCRTPASSGEWMELTTADLERAFGSAVTVSRPLPAPAGPWLKPLEIQAVLFSFPKDLTLTPAGFKHLSYFPRGSQHLPVRCGLTLREPSLERKVTIAADLWAWADSIRLEHSAIDDPITGEAAGWNLNLRLTVPAGWAPVWLTCHSDELTRGMSLQDLKDIASTWLELR